MEENIQCGRDNSSYTNGCRCPACKAAHAAYMREWRVNWQARHGVLVAASEEKD